MSEQQRQIFSDEFRREAVGLIARSGRTPLKETKVVHGSRLDAEVAQCCLLIHTIVSGGCDSMPISASGRYC